MRGRLYIDDIDIYRKFGAFIIQGGYNDLLSPAVFKPFDAYDWADEDGIDPDLSNPVLDSRKISLSFGTVDTEDSEDLLYMLADNGAYHDFHFAELGITQKLRLTGHAINRILNPLEKFTIDLSDDFPPLATDVVEPPICPVKQGGYHIDGVPFADYGVFILDGSDEEIIKSPEVKQNLILNFAAKAGIDYDNELVKFKSKDVALKCLMYVPDMATYNRNAAALLHALIQAGERAFHVERFTEIYPCYYKSWKVTRFEVLRRCVWCEFTLTLVFTRQRPRKTVYVIGTEDGRIISTEDSNTQSVTFIQAEGWQKKTKR